MPTYDYRCATCGIDFELFQSFSDDALKKCPTRASGNSPLGCTSAGRGKVEKVFSAPGITFKGSGFYKTDSRPDSKKSAAASGDTDSKSSDAESSDSKTSDEKSTSASSDTKAGSKASDTKSGTTKSAD